MSDLESDGEPIFHELQRILGDHPDGSVAASFVLLPLVSASDALAFLRTVPAGTRLEALPELALTYRAHHPVARSDAAAKDGDAAG